LRTFFLNLTFKKAFHEKKRQTRHFINKKYIFSSKFKLNFYIWIRIRNPAYCPVTLTARYMAENFGKPIGI